MGLETGPQTTRWVRVYKEPVTGEVTAESGPRRGPACRRSEDPLGSGAEWQRASHARGRATELRGPGPWRGRGTTGAGVSSGLPAVRRGVVRVVRGDAPVARRSHHEGRALQSRGFDPKAALPTRPGRGGRHGADGAV